MVLSKKKLKQQSRSEFEQISLPNHTVSDTNSDPSHKISKRENLSSLQINGESSDAHVVEASEGKKKKKRKREKTNGGKSQSVVKELEESVEEIQRRERKRIKNEKRKLRLKDENGRRIRVNKQTDITKQVKTPPPASNKKNKKKKNKKKKKKKAEADKEEKQNDVFPEKTVDKTCEENDDDSSKKVYVGGMPYSSTEDDIWNYFDHCGVITDIDCMKFPESGKFRGIAIISFKTQEAAKKALALDGSDMDGLYLKIQPFKTTRPSTTTKSSDFSTPVIEGYNRIYVGNLSWDITEDDLRHFFSNCNISSIRFGEDKETGEFKGYAHVDFADNASLTNALKLDQKLVCGRPIKISRAVPMKGTPKTLGSTPTPEPAVKPEENKGGVGSGKLRRRTCYECGEKGHLSSDCPKKQASEQTNLNAS